MAQRGFQGRLKAIWLVLEEEILRMEHLLEIPDSVWTEKMASLEDIQDIPMVSQDFLGFLVSKTAFLDFKMDFQDLQVVLQVR